MTRLGCRIAALGVGVMVRVGLLVRTELASRAESGPWLAGAQ